MYPRSGGLWRHRDFVKLWAGQSVSMLGSQVTQMALPLTAAQVLNAAPFQMGMLNAVQYAPFLLFGLFAGVWVDRLRRRPILFAADLGRAVLLAFIPAAAVAGALRLEQLYIVGFLAGTLTLFFDVAQMSYLPSLIARERLVEGNSKLGMSRSIASIAGPGLAGGLVEVATAPVAILLDSVSFLVSACFLAFIRVTEPPPAAPSGRTSFWGQMGQGIQLVLRNSLLRPIALSAGTLNFFTNIVFAMHILYITRDLGFPPPSLARFLPQAAPDPFAGRCWRGRPAGSSALGPALPLPCCWMAPLCS